MLSHDRQQQQQQTSMDKNQGKQRKKRQKCPNRQLPMQMPMLNEQKTRNAFSPKEPTNKFPDGVMTRKCRYLSKDVRMMQDGRAGMLQDGRLGSVLRKLQNEGNEKKNTKHHPRDSSLVASFRMTTPTPTGPNRRNTKENISSPGC